MIQGALHPADRFSHSPSAKSAALASVVEPASDFLPAAVTGAAQQHVCTDADLAGAFGFRLTGVNLTEGAAYAIVGRFASDGKQMLTGSGIENTNGNVAQAPFTGKYELRPDCTGDAQLSFAAGRRVVDLEFVLAASGNEVLMLATSQGTVESGTAIKQFSAAARRNSARNAAARSTPRAFGLAEIRDGASGASHLFRR